MIEEQKIEIYKIYDEEDKGFDEIYMTAEQIEFYLDEVQENIPNYNEEDSWTDNLKRYGLVYESIWNNYK